MVTTAAKALLVDTSVLLEASNRARRQHTAALSLLEQHNQLVFPAQVAREFLVVATRPPEVNGLGLTSRAALESLTAFRRNVRLLPEEKPLLPTLLRLVEELSIVGKRVHDAHIVAAAVVHRVKAVVTLNGDDFRAFGAQVRCVTPADATG